MLSYYREPAWERADRIAREQAAHEAIGAWFALHMRPVTVTSRDAINLGLDPDRTERWPVREGFMDRVNTWCSWGRDRCATHADEAEHLKVDRVALGVNDWDADCDWHPKVCYPVYAARTDIPMEHPFYEGTGKNPNVEFHYGAPGRFELQAMVPEALARLVYRCLESATRPCGDCTRCHLNAFYHRFCKGKPLDAIATIDDKVERKCRIGR